MSQSNESYTLIIQIRLDNSGDVIRYKIDQLTVAEGKVPTAQIHFDCLHCKTRYYISTKVLQLMELDMIPDEKPAIEVKKVPEFDYLESGSSIEDLSDDGGDEKQDIKNEMLENEMLENEMNVLESGSSMEILSDDGTIEVQGKGHKIPVVTYDIVKKERELNIPESGSSDEPLSDDEADTLQGVGPEIPVAPVNNLEIQPPEIVENENSIQIQVLDLHPFVPLARIDAEKKGQDRQKVQLQKRTSKPKRKRFTCDICKASIKFRSALVYHMNAFHLGVRFSCSECQVSFIDINNLAKHKKRFHQSEAKAGNSSQLRSRHPEFKAVQPRQNVEKFNRVDFPCIYCEPQATFKTFGELKTHLGVTHDRKFACTQCPKAWKLQADLNRHIFFHIQPAHEKKSFHCTKCDKVFMWKTNLCSHLRSHKM